MDIAWDGTPGPFSAAVFDWQESAVAVETPPIPVPVTGSIVYLVNEMFRISGAGQDVWGLAGPSPHRTRTVCRRPVPERSALEYRVSLRSADTDLPVPPSSFAGLTLTLYKDDGSLVPPIVNGLSDTRILNDGRGILGVDGRLVVILSSADLTLVDGTAPHEHHVMLLEGTHINGAHAFRKEVGYVLLNLARVP